MGGMRAPEKINATSLGAVGLLFFVLALTPVGEFWQPVREIRDIYLWIGMFATALVVTVVRAERRRIDSLDLWMLGVWAFVGFAVVGLSALWPVLLLGALLGATIRLAVKVVFQGFEELSASVMPDR